MFGRLVPQAKADAAVSLDVSGTNLYNAAGQQVVLRGVMCGDDYWQFGLSPSQSSIQTIANAGCNFFQFEGILWSTLEPSNGSYSSSYLAVLDNIASQCEASHMYFCFDFYGLSQGAPWKVNAIPSWCDVPDQYSAVSDYADHFVTFEAGFYDLNNAAYNNARSAFAACLQFLADRYESNPYFMIGLFNEPFNPGYSDNYIGSLDLTDNPTLSAEYAATCTWLYNQIMATGYTGLVEVDNPWCNIGLSSPSQVTGANVVWDCHAYVCSLWNTTLSGWETGISTLISQYETVMSKPIIMGEWGYLDSSGNDSDQIPDWATVENMYQSQISYMDSQNLAGASWFNFDQLYGSGCDGPNGFQFTSSETSTILSIVSQGAESVPSPQYSPIDFFHQGKVDTQDYFYFINAYIQYQTNGIYNPACDLNHDGKIDIEDFFLFIYYYTQNCSISSD